MKSDRLDGRRQITLGLEIGKKMQLRNVSAQP